MSDNIHTDDRTDVRMLRYTSSVITIRRCCAQCGVAIKIQNYCHNCGVTLDHPLSVKEYMINKFVVNND